MWGCAYGCSCVVCVLVRGVSACVCLCVSVRGCVCARSHAGSGGGLAYLASTTGSITHPATLSLTSVTFANNTASQSGGAIHAAVTASSPTAVLIPVVTMTSCQACGNVAVAGRGGGMAFSLPTDVQREVSCRSPPAFTNYTHSVAVVVTDSAIDGNVAQCPFCDGGGMFSLVSGGMCVLLLL